MNLLKINIRRECERERGGRERGSEGERERKDVYPMCLSFFVGVLTKHKYSKIQLGNTH